MPEDRCSTSQRLDTEVAQLLRRELFADYDPPSRSLVINGLASLLASGIVEALPEPPRQSSYKQEALTSH
jgi:hypothetical protein